MKSSAPPQASQDTVQGPQAATSRRRHDRLSLRCPVQIQLAAPPEREGTLQDMSPQGLSLFTARPIEPGSRCTLRLVLPLPSGPREVALAAKAVYSSYTGPGVFRIGMLFMALSPDAQTAVRELLG